MDTGNLQPAQLGDLDGFTFLVLVEESEHGFLNLTARTTLALCLGGFTAGSVYPKVLVQRLEHNVFSFHTSGVRAEGTDVDIIFQRFGELGHEIRLIVNDSAASAMLFVGYYLLQNMLLHASSLVHHG